jgi:hypothetical protein
MTFEDIVSSVCTTVSSISARITKEICTHFNDIPLTLEQVKKYCDWNWELWVPYSGQNPPHGCSSEKALVYFLSKTLAIFSTALTKR